jgi:hypothetical protein
MALVDERKTLISQSVKIFGLFNAQSDDVQ